MHLLDSVGKNKNINYFCNHHEQASAICADLILNEVDFISVGTNDLIQYLLAVDRINEQVAHLYQPYNPAVLKTLKYIFSAAENART